MATKKKRVICISNNLIIKVFIWDSVIFFFVMKKIIVLSKDRPTSKINKDASVMKRENIPLFSTPKFLAIISPVKNCNNCNNTFENMCLCIIDVIYNNYPSCLIRLNLE